MHWSKRLRLAMVTAGEWVMVLPAAVLLAATALRYLQPSRYEPARTSWIISEWATAHISRLGAAILFIAVPCLAVLVGCVSLVQTWREDQSLRQDARVVLTILQRRCAIGLLTAGTLLAAAIFVFTVIHVVVD